MHHWFKPGAACQGGGGLPGSGGTQVCQYVPGHQSASEAAERGGRGAGSRGI